MDEKMSPSECFYRGGEEPADLPAANVNIVELELASL
jgi:hypothetical protein